MPLTIKAEKRDVFGSNASGRLRRAGRVPAVLYGEKVETVPLTIEKLEILKIMRSETRENTLFRLAFDGQERDAMIKELQIDATNDHILHADLIQIAMDKPIRVTVPVVHSGEPIGVKTEGGFVDFTTRVVEVECLPKDIPESLGIEISGLHVHQSFKAQDIALPAGVKLISDPATVVLTVALPHQEQEAKGEKPEEVMAEEGKEPEVIKKERAEKPEGEAAKGGEKAAKGGEKPAKGGEKPAKGGEKAEKKG